MQEMDKTLEEIKEIVEDLGSLYDTACQMYSDAVEYATKQPNMSEQQVEKLLDGLFDFIDDIRFFELYKKMCIHVMHQYPDLVKDHMRMFRAEKEERELDANEPKMEDSE